MFKNMKIQKRLTVSFIMVSIIASVAGIVGAIAMSYIANQYNYALTNYGFSQGDIGKAMVTFADAHSATRAVIGYTDAAIVKSEVSNHDSKKASCEQYLATMKNTLTTSEEEAAYAKIQTALDAFWKKDAEVIALGNTTDETLSAQAQELAANELLPLYDSAYEAFSELMALNVDTGNDLSSSLATLRTVLLIVIIAVIVVAIVLSIMLGNNIAGGIAAPLRKLSDRLVTFAGGNLSEEFPKTDSKDEVADMVGVASNMAKNLALIIEDAKHRLGEMAKGDYTVESRMAEKYVGEFEALHVAIHQMNMNMNETLHQIEEASAQVSAGANNLAEGSQSLAEGATEQAGAVEELVATMTNLTEGISQTSENVDESYNVSRKYANRANESREEMQGLVETMNRITETSQKIGSIIAEIEEIASQTNMLSLNASIEAARAGDAGRGFAVVASQIGKLADESAQSAVNTRELITSAISEIEAGTQAVNRTASTIDDVVQGINQVAESSKEVSDLTKVQAETMKQAEAGLNQISEVVQANSATAEESSATSEELSAQASSLDSLVKRFTLKK